MSGTAVVVPARVRANWREWWPELAEAVERDVLRRAREAVEAWGLRELAPMRGGQVAVVIGAVSSGHGACVLKVNPDVPGERFDHEPRALQAWSVRGRAPAVMGARDGGLTLLLRRIVPGASLGAVERDPLRVSNILGGLAGQLHLDPDVAMDGSGLPPLGEGSAADEWRAALAGARDGTELELLLAPSTRDRLLHLDLHCLNVLRAEAGWVAIDPKPHVGDPHAEVFGFLYGPPVARIPRDATAARRYVETLLSVYANAAHLDAGRLRRWVHLRALATLPTITGRWDATWADNVKRMADATA